MKTSRLCLAMLAGLLPTFIAHSELPPQNSIPALLQFAEQYQQQSPSTPGPQPLAEPTKRTDKKALRTVKSHPAEPAKRPSSWQIKDTELQHLRATVTELRQQLSVLQKQQAQQPEKVKTPTVDWQGIGQLARNLRQAITITPTEQQATEQLKLSAQQRSQLATLKLQYSELQQQRLQERAETKRRVTESENALVSLRNHSERQITQLQTALSAIQSRSPLSVSAEQLKMAKNRQDYAAGVSLGEEILQMQAERARWGVKTDKQLILAGISDTFAGERRLADDVLNASLANAEKEVGTAREETLASQAKAGGSYLAKFKQDKLVKQANSGFWYKIDYAGDTTLTAGASVDVVVKEMLTDGTVIQDMEASGASLSQSVDAFPPLFKEAILLLKNHGSMTLVVPPEQAYGEKGYPPKVPPNATMVYQLRIAEMYPAGKLKTNTAAN